MIPKRAWIAALMAGGLLIAAPLLAASRRPAKGRAKNIPPRSFVVAGVLVDSDGLPVENLPVLVQASKGPIARDPRLDRGRYKVVGRDRTDADGVYRVIFPVEPANLRYFLSFYSFGAFDDVRYARPERIDITRQVATSQSLLLDYRLKNHGDWPKIQKLLKVYPPNSSKARVIRKYGIAEEITKAKEKNGVEVWWYYTKGKRFSFRGTALLKERTFAPVLK